MWLWFFSPCILQEVYCMRLGQQAFYLHVKSIKVFIEGLYLAELFECLLIVLRHHFTSYNASVQKFI